MRDPVLVTGAAGRLGSVVARGLHAEGFDVRLTDIVTPPEDLAHLPFRVVDLVDQGATASLLVGAGAVIHMAGHPNSRDWGVVGALNVEASWNVFTGAVAAGVRSVVFASSTHVVGRHPAGSQLDTRMPLAPDSPYGLSKAAVEGLLADLCRTHPLAGYSLRIGACREDPRNARELGNWLSHSDLVRVVIACLKRGAAGYETVWAISNNRRALVDRTEWGRIGYAPLDNAETFEPLLRAAGVDTTSVSEWSMIGGEVADQKA